jgi:hypothetical protein
MTDDELLQRAIKALRDEELGDAPAGARHRMLQAAGRARKLETRQTVVTLALGLALVASTAAATGQLQRAVAALKAVVVPVVPAPQVVVPQKSNARAGHYAANLMRIAPSMPACATPTATVAQVPVDEAAAVSPRERESAPHTTSDRHVGRMRVAPVALEALPELASTDEALQQFRVAQRLHAQHQWQAALAAWGKYLQLVPSGELAPEARWSRAQCLVRLGRGAAAQAALQPFASGAEGGYHQADAAELLQALANPSEPTQ